MANITIITEVVTVKADFLRNVDGVQLPLVAVPESKPGEQFFHCMSSNWKIHGLLVADRFVDIFGSRQKALSKTDVLKTLKTLKDDEWHRQVAESCGESAIQRYTRGEKRAKLLQFESTVVIAAPQFSGVESVRLVFALNKPAVGLVMLLTPEAIEYLRNAVSAQLEAGGSRSSEQRSARCGLPDIDRVDTQVPNLTWSYTKNKFRATYWEEKEDGSKKRCQFLTESKDLAMTFVKTGTRPDRRTSLPGRQTTLPFALSHKHGRPSSDDDGAASSEPSAAEDEDAAYCSDRDDQSSVDRS